MGYQAITNTCQGTADSEAIFSGAWKDPDFVEALQHLLRELQRCADTRWAQQPCS